MIIQCTSCSRKFVVKDKDIPKEGRLVQCGYCSVSWHQLPTTNPTKLVLTDINSNALSDVIKASDGKTYKFLGKQWAQVLSSGKTGLFAKKKIGKELNKLTGKKEIKVSKKKSSVINPSTEIITNAKLPDIYKPNSGIGFFGYIFLIIIISFCLIGVMKTFEEDWLNHFPQHILFFTFVDQQLDIFTETFKNIITIIKDLINSY
jgi:predicted Zn finger-like uncharacterized protein